MYKFVFVVTVLFSIGAVYAWLVLLPTTFNVLYSIRISEQHPALLLG